MPGVKYSLIEIPNDQNLGTGRYTTVIEPATIANHEAIISMIVNVPIFQLSVNINPATKEIPVLLGKADGSDPISRKTFSLPDNIELKREYPFIAEFNNWDITSLSMNGVQLIRKTLPGTITFWIDPRTNPGAFTEGVNYSWGVFYVNGEKCTVVSEGKTLLAFLNKDTSDERMVFSKELDFDPSFPYAIAITWDQNTMNLYINAEKESSIEID